MKEAVAHFQKGLTLIEQLPPSDERDSLELTIREPLNAAWTGLRGWAAPEVGVNAAAILRLAESGGNAHSLLLATWWVWTSTITQGRIADSLQWVDRLLAAGRERGDTDLQIFGHATAMVHHFLNGRLVESREEADRALALYDPRRAEQWIQLTGHELRTFIEVYACQLLWMLGFPEQAARLSDQARAHAQADGHAFNLVWAVTFSAYVFAYRREPERFLERVGEADRLARDQGLAFIYEVSVPQAQGLAELQNGRPREAISLLRQGIERWTKTGGNVRVPFLKSALAEAEALDGDPEAALELIDECLKQIERPAGQERLWLAEVLRIKGWILMRQNRDEEAEPQLRASIECARQQQAKSWELRSATTLATLLARRGEFAAAHELLAPIYGWFTEGADTKDLIEARVLLEGLSP
jgi:tetratricopeptide (TPR) repeat protein